jgi:hypothetical protein
MMANVGVVVGSSPRIRVRFRTSDNNPVDPTTVKFKYQDSEFNETSYTYGIGTSIVKSDTGNYYCDVPVTLPDGFDRGKYFCKWEAFDANGVGLAAPEVILEVSTRYPTRRTV